MKKQWKSLFEYYGFTEKEAKEYPVVSRILKQLTPERIEKEIREIQKVKLPPELQKWLREYEKVGERTYFLWKWLYKADKIGIKAFNIPRRYFYYIVKISFFFNMFINLIDDASERKMGKGLLNELLKIPFNQKDIEFNKLNKEEEKYLKFTMKVWQEIEKRVKKLPYYKDLMEIFEHDVQRLLNTARYSSLVYRNPYLINKTDYWMYLPQNMEFMIASDLCYMSFRFNFKNIGLLREVILYTQKMARIGNDMGTWEREIKKDDFVNGICVYAVDLGIFTVDELKNGDKFKIIEKIKKSKIEEILFKEWERSYCKIKEIIERNKLEELDVKKFLSVLEKITLYHLAGRGYI